MTIAPLIPSEIANRATAAQIQGMLDHLGKVNPGNKTKGDYYEGDKLVAQSRVIPKEWVDTRQAAGWPGTVVDVLEERLDLLGWAGGDVALTEAFTANDLATESCLGHLDALIYGLAFIAADTDDPANPRVTVESPLSMTGTWDHQKRRLSQALLIARQTDSQPTEVVLFGEWENTRYVREAGLWRAVDRSDHQMGRCPVVQLVNRPRASRQGGRSEITQSIRRYTDSAVKTLAAMEVNRDFYSFPQRWTTGADDDDFTDDTGADIPGWKTAMATHLVIGTNADGQQPSMGTFSVNPPTVYLDQIRGLAQMVAAEAGVPAHYMGFVADNPASGDGIRAGEARLVKRAERRQGTFGRAWTEMARIVATSLGKDTAGLSCTWRDPATPTRAATADEVMKLISTGILTADSSIAYDRIGLTPAEQTLLRDEKRSAPTAGADLLAAALNRQRQTPSDGTDAPRA
ncbi:MAG: phage portal protein [Propionibacteriales bacterium]|nr:phage portal protein [Propionibacteriales bacterium]